MKAISVKEPFQIELIDLEKPIPKKGEALLEVLYVGICGSDMSLYKGKMSGYASYPRIPGHELAARIVEIDENNEYGLKKGMTVTVNPYYNCGKCYSCRRGFVNCCVDNQTMGLAREGVCAQYITMPLERIYNGKELDPLELALIEPFCISYHGVKRAEIQPGENVLVVGSGTIGLFAMVAAKLKGASVIMCDVAEEKLKMAVNVFDADGYILNDNNDTFVEKVLKTTQGNKFDVAIEAVGFPSTLQNCLDAVASVGRVVEIGIGTQSMDFAYSMIQKKEIMLIGSRNAMREDFEELIDLANEKKVDLKKFISEVADFRDAAEIFEKIAKDPGKNIKTVLKF